MFENYVGISHHLNVRGIMNFTRIFTISYDLFLFFNLHICINASRRLDSRRS